jgi:hypothetical protein
MAYSPTLRGFCVNVSVSQLVPKRDWKEFGMGGRGRTADGLGSQVTLSGPRHRGFCFCFCFALLVLASCVSCRGNNAASASGDSTDEVMTALRFVRALSSVVCSATHPTQPTTYSKPSYIPIAFIERPPLLFLLKARFFF